MNKKANHPVPDPASPAPGAVIAGRYEIRRALGSGGSGAVFQAWDKQLQRHVAVKRWHPLEPLPDDPEGRERLWREAMTLAAIQHPNILTIHDFGVDEEGPYVITEYVDGETLDRAIQQGPFDCEAFAEAAQQTLEALIAAHQAGLIHRDLKPQNIMRMRLASGAWQYKILDFGLARFVTQPTVQSLEGNTSIYGSILYIAPEQLRHQPLDARTDIYSIGCVFYYMLSGKSAVEGDSIPALITSHLQHQVKPLAELRPDLPAALCDWVMKAVAFDPKDRYPTAVAALAALRKVLPTASHSTTIRVAPPVSAGIRIMVPPPVQRTGPIAAPMGQTGPIAPAAPSPTRWRWVLLGAVALVLAAVGAGIRFRPWAQPAAPAAPVAPATPAVAVSSWRDESLPAEEIITAWPASIAEARRPLVQRYFEQLRDLDAPHWRSIGAVLETLATVQFNATNNPNRMRALCNLTYHDATNLTLGELDVVIWNVRENRAEVVYEVVVSDQLNRKAIPSRNQIQRFADSIKDGRAAKILDPADPDRKLEPGQFAQARIAIMGNQGALAAGFEAEVDITRFETDFLQRKLIDWRNARRPKRKPKD